MTETTRQLKISLYLALLKVPEEELTCLEVDLLFLLAADQDVQSTFDQSLNGN